MVAKKDFTDRFLKSVKPAPAGKRVILYDAQVPGFGIRMTDKSCPADVGAFVLVARYPGSSNPAPRRIGDYPAMSLAEARDIARQWREDVQRGVDPKVKEAERLRAEARRRADTFASVFEAFAEDHLATLRTGDGVKRAIANHVLPRWGDRPIRDLTRGDVSELVRVVKKSAPIAANRVLAHLKTFFRWAVRQDIIENSPAASVERPAKENRRERVLSDRELREVWRRAADLGYPFGDFARLLLMTGQRRSEVANAEWKEFDLDQAMWTIPAPRMKGDVTHEVPLPEPVVAVLREMPRGAGPFVFSTTEGRRPISGFSKAKAALDSMLEEVEPWTFHDLRRTMRTHLGGLPVPTNVAEMIIAHAQPGLHRVYDRHSYRDEKRRALELWNARLAAIVDPPTGNVVSIARASL
jgi:integrase